MGLGALGQDGTPGRVVGEAVIERVEPSRLGGCWWHFGAIVRYARPPVYAPEGRRAIGPMPPCPVGTVDGSVAPARSSAMW